MDRVCMWTDIISIGSIILVSENNTHLHTRALALAWDRAQLLYSLYQDQYYKH